MFRCASCGAFNRVREPQPPGQPTRGRCQRALELSSAHQEVARQSGRMPQAELERWALSEARGGSPWASA
jgi:hypothetical protein